MPTRSAQAQWKGNLKQGEGQMKTQSGALDGKFGFGSRFEQSPGTNPEELIAAAHAGCFSMALAAGLSQAGHEPKSVNTTAKVTVENIEGGFAITRSALQTRVESPGMDDATLQKFAQEAKVNCPVSKALKGVEITLVAELAAPA